MMNKLIKAIKNSKYAFLRLITGNHFEWMNDEDYLKMMYHLHMDKKLDLDNPKTFNEKLQWLKIHDRKPEYITMVDKYAVKKYVADIIGEEYIIPTLGKWDRFDDIDFDALPNQFVLKCNHDSGGLVIVRDKSKFDKKAREAAKKKIEKSLKQNYYWPAREWPYKDVKPCIIAEKYMEDSATEELVDYKFMCFDGQVKCCFTCSDRFSSKGLHVTFFDNDWNVMPFDRHYPRVKEGLPKPINFELMKNLAEKLSHGIKFVRVDFYEVNGKVYFGELTFFPGSGYEEFTPEEWDYKIGDWIDLVRS